MKNLTIQWQRLVDESGRTCDRCRNTGNTVETAFRKLQKALAEFDIQVNLETKSIDYTEFKRDPLRSNQIRINDRPLEEWIGGAVSKSRCCDVCGDSECRTILIGTNTFEAIPEHLIIRAGLLAASELLMR